MIDYGGGVISGVEREAISSVVVFLSVVDYMMCRFRAWLISGKSGVRCEEM